jgi:hypothetical protein
LAILGEIKKVAEPKAIGTIANHAHDGKSIELATVVEDLVKNLLGSFATPARGRSLIIELPLVFW